MSFTELSVFPLVTSGISPDLQAVLKKAQIERQVFCSDTWTFQQVEDPSIILVATNWASQDTHREWIQSQSYASIKKSITEFTKIGDGEAQRISLGTKLLSVSNEGELTPLVYSPVISIGRMFISADKKDAFVDKFNEVREIVEKYARPFEVRCAWRTNKEGKSKEEFVMIAGWPAVEKHKEFASSPGFAKYLETKEFLDGADIRHYQRIILSEK
ncbi:hypothetical protein NQ176_g10424 [Zarea fungicola]|uniref:Uncharacterized protein n=1 Tax=Zarea fungicola TaxID=93591 RepID=A0ACC1MFQ1_9HYPO|nr:hypothetical protein NQ176_g10424 [Lecanicillium fungicola]